MLGWNEIENRATAFQKYWKNKSGDEKQEAQKFEIDFMNIFGVDFHDGRHEHAITLNDGSTGYMDYFLPGKILIEMKSKGKSLNKAYTQAMAYYHALKSDEKPVLIMTCDFDTIEVHNLEKDHRYKPFKVSQLKKHVRIFGILAGYDDAKDIKTEIELNTDASYKMAKLHDQLKKYNYTGHNLEVFLVRLLFCLFAEDTGIFEKNAFRNFVANSKEDGSDLSGQIMELFHILDTPVNKRMTNLGEELKNFRYINGKLFSEKLPPAAFDKNMRQILLDCCDFDWNQISPSIFGAMFQGVMDQKRRREMGAHYTSEENILKVIEPLFLDDLNAEFEKSKHTKKDMEAFHQKLASLRFLDPACGSGNFLLVAYQKLRELEAKVIEYIYRDEQDMQLTLFLDEIIKVRITQFYGIEYEEFPCEIGKVSMFLMKHLLDQEIGSHYGINVVDFPIRENANIICGNALQMDWLEVCGGKVDYIMGNPPFIGKKYMAKEQKDDMAIIFKNKIKSYKSLDYVASWFYKSSIYLKETTRIKVAFVSTNSICQGEQAANLWQPILEYNNCKIDFAYKPFLWNNAAKGKDRVHCVIIGLSNKLNKIAEKFIVSELGEINKVKNINAYLISGEDIFIKRRTNHIQNLLKMEDGNLPIDGNFLKVEPEEYEEFKDKEPQALKYIKNLVGGDNFISKKPRYVLWLVDVPISEIRKMPMVAERVHKVREFRLASNEKHTQKLADSPHLFASIRNPKAALIIPRVSSEKRKYIPIGFTDDTTIALNQVVLLPNAEVLEFAILTSNVHMAWMRAFAGRLEMRYRYSVSVVYNNFPFPKLDDEVKAKLEETGRKILEVREKYPNDSYADLYDDTFMPLDLRKAHQQNDRAVWEAYGKAWDIGSESECVAHLMKLYKEMTK